MGHVYSARGSEDILAIGADVVAFAMIVGELSSTLAMPFVVSVSPGKCMISTSILEEVICEVVEGSVEGPASDSAGTASAWELLSLRLLPALLLACFFRLDGGRPAGGDISGEEYLSGSMDEEGMKGWPSSSISSRML